MPNSGLLSGQDQPSGIPLVLGFPAHDQRAAAIGEVHARPAPALRTPAILVQLAFLSEASVDFSALSELSRQRGISPPDKFARHHSMEWGNGSLRWERHTEFTTYLWENALSENADDPLAGMPFGSGFPVPGAVICGVRVEIRKWTKAAETQAGTFDQGSLCHSTVEGGAAAILTDFRQDKDGLTRIVILDKSLTPVRAGALAKHLIEIETYRTLALFGLPLAQRLSPRLRRVEDRLAILTSEMKDKTRRDSQALLAELTEIAAMLEADAASSLYRFGASRAYDGLVDERLAALDETPMPGAETFTAFLQRRMAPAMRTCRSVEKRQDTLSRRLARAATLLRTWVDVELERQNRALLTSMNSRARQQLRMQQTVEGLSVAAISYYVIGLIGYAAKGFEPLLPGLKAPVLMAAAVPVTLAAVWLLVRRIRRSHSEH